MKNYCYILIVLLLFACNRKPSTCAAYQDIGTVAIPEDDYVPTNFIITERQTKTGLVKKVGGVNKKRHKTRRELSKLFKKEKKYIKDKEIFPESDGKTAGKKKPKKSKAKSKRGENEEIEQPTDENSPTEKPEKQEEKKDGN
ncbi:MAG: hypothetical protein RMJ97_02685 [Raineya sp.]|nr:hypothetical protein [Raineya sp.]MDW8295768.1 hypothetical protein [Raineya sp.]